MSNTRDILNLSAVELRNAVASGAVSAQQAVRAYLEAVSQRDGAVGAYVEVFAERSLERAASIDEARAAGRAAGPLAGVPVAVADNICTEFGRTTCGSKILAQFRSPFSATAVAKLESAGAIVLGKAAVDEFGMGASTEPGGGGGGTPTRNPWDASRVAGGNGAAAAVAGRLAAAAIGGDTGGAVRQAAAFCGVVGVKPTYGRVSRFGLAEYGSSLEQIGPMTRDVADAAVLLSVLAGQDANDATSVALPAADFLAGLDQPPTGLRVGLPKEFFHQDDQALAAGALDTEILAALQQAVEAFKAAGATLVEVSLPHSRAGKDARGNLYSHAVAAYGIIAMSEASSNLARFGGMHFDRRTDQPCNDVHELYARSRAEGFGDEVKLQVMLGTHMLTAGLYDTYYTKALQVRRLIKNDFDQAFRAQHEQRCDVLLCPTTPTPPPPFGEKIGDPLARHSADLYTCSANLAGLPAVALPAGVSKTGLPIGIQLLAPAFGEDTLLRAARMYERQVGATRWRPAGF